MQDAANFLIHKEKSDEVRFFFVKSETYIWLLKLPDEKPAFLELFSLPSFIFYMKT